MICKNSSASTLLQKTTLEILQLEYQGDEAKMIRSITLCTYLMKKKKKRKLLTKNIKKCFNLFDVLGVKELLCSEFSKNLYNILIKENYKLKSFKSKVKVLLLLQMLFVHNVHSVYI